MDELLHIALSPDPALPWESVALSLLLAFLLSSVIAQVYIWTHRGLSYSRSYIQALVLGAIVSATLMLAIGNNLARGLGILGTLAIIRFRSTMKDPRDMVFVFSALAVGTAVGMRSYAAALIGTGMFVGAAGVLDVSAFGSRNRFDGLVRLQVPAEPVVDEEIRRVLGRYCRRWVLIALREVEQGRQAEYNYHVKLLDPREHGPLVQDLSALPGARGVSFFLQDASEEI